MTKAKEEELMTYLLDGVPQEAYEEMRKTAKEDRQKKRRVILVTTVRPNRKYIVREIPGNQLFMLRQWITRSVLDDLHDDYEKDHRKCTPKVQKAAIDEWKASLVAKEMAEKALELAQDEVYARSADIVRTHGRGPILIDGETYDPGYSETRVYLIPRKGPPRTSNEIPKEVQEKARRA